MTTLQMLAVIGAAALVLRAAIRHWVRINRSGR